MSYSTAKKLFGEMKRTITAKSNPVFFDLSSGLHTLTVALDEDSCEIRKKLDRIEKLLLKIQAK
jgi:hypothetical protein